MTEPLFAGSQAKLERARKFIAELGQELSAYNASNPLTAIAVAIAGPVNFKLEITFQGQGLLPGIILGDVLHNLRSALDLMASELARINGQDDRNVYFPFSESKTTLAHTIKSKHFYKAGPDAVALLETLAPYKGGNERLRAIHDLNIRDKHTAIIETKKDANFRVSGKVVVTVAAERQPVPIILQDIQHSFWSGSPLADLPLIKTLEELVELVESILEAFRGLVLARK